jgi:cell shape-determining protein MreC
LSKSSVKVPIKAFVLLDEDELEELELRELEELLLELELKLDELELEDERLEELEELEVTIPDNSLTSKLLHPIAQSLVRVEDPKDSKP